MKRGFIPVYVQIILRIYLFLIGSFTLFRLVLLATEWGENPALDGVQAELLLQAFFMGWRFDTVICAYILSLPLILLFCAEKFRKQIFIRIAFSLIRFFGIVSLFIHAADIPFFSQFYSRFNTAAFAWVDSPSFVVRMIVTEPKYWLFIFLFLIMTFVFVYWMNKQKKALTQRLSLVSELQGTVKLYLSLPLMLLIALIAMRGRLEQKSPIRVGTAFFSNNSFINQMGLNPVFTLIKSFEHDSKSANRKIHYMEDEKAVELSRKFVGVGTGLLDHPIARRQDSKAEKTKQNVVLVLMESMSAEKMGLYGNEKNATPYLDSLAKSSWYFSNFYSAGIHTYNGIYSTLFGHPALLKQHAMKKVRIPQMYGFPHIMKEHGYYTAYFTTHDDQFDNVGGFLYENKFDKVYSEKDYPGEEVVSTLGVPDHYLYKYGLEKLDEMHATGKPFFTAFMTGSDHPPYTIPEDISFTSETEEIKDRIVEYVDWSVEQFIEEAKKKDWFDNTLFVFIADHGVRVNDPYLMPLSYHHIPCILYQPSRIREPRELKNLGGQIDLLPTLADYLGLSFDNYTLGMNLFGEERPYMYFSADAKYGVVNDSLYLIVNEGKEFLYNYRTRSTESIADQYPDLITEMKDYYASMTQLSQILLDKGICSPK